MTFPWRAWVRFYFKLSLVSAWNGILRFLYVAAGAGTAQITQAIDLRTLGVKGAGWVLAGTVAASVAGALYRYPMTEPKEPGDPVAVPVVPVVPVVVDPAKVTEGVVPV